MVAITTTPQNSKDENKFPAFLMFSSLSSFVYKTHAYTNTNIEIRATHMKIILIELTYFPYKLLNLAWLSLPISINT